LPPVNYHILRTYRLKGERSLRGHEIKLVYHCDKPTSRMKGHREFKIGVIVLGSTHVTRDEFRAQYDQRSRPRDLTIIIAHQHPYHAAHLVTVSVSDSVPLLNVRALQMHSVERMYLRQRCFDGSVNITI